MELIGGEFEIDLFHYYVYLPWIRFHLWTALILVAQFFIVLYITRHTRINALVLATLSATLSIHFYETIHGLFDLTFRGSVGVSLWKMNIPLTLVCILFLIIYDRKYNVITKLPALSILYLIVFFLNMIWLALTGFFGHFDFNNAWAFSKITVSIFIVSLFWRDPLGHHNSNEKL